jgi:raffinose/stachyose/melibiose transport system permease protein
VTTTQIDLDTRTASTMGAPGKSRYRRGRRSLVHFGRWWWSLPAIAFIVGAHYASTLTGAFFSLTNWSGLGDWDFIGLQNFIEIAQSPETVGALRNTFFLAIVSVIIANVIGLLYALAINRMLRTRYILRTLLFMPVVLSPLAVAYVWKYIFDFNGPVNWVLGAVGLESLQKTWLADPTWSIWVILIVMVWQSIGLMMVIYLAGLASVPVEVEEAAALDGANIWQRFRHVTVPAIRPSIAIATTLGIIQGLSIFDQIKALTNGGPFGATETLATQVYTYAFAQGQFGFGSALALVLTGIIFVFAIVQQYITRDRSA